MSKEVFREADIREKDDALALEAPDVLAEQLCDLIKEQLQLERKGPIARSWLPTTPFLNVHKSMDTVLNERSRVVQSVVGVSEQGAIETEIKHSIDLLASLITVASRGYLNHAYSQIIGHSLLLEHGSELTLTRLKMLGLRPKLYDPQASLSSPEPLNPDLSQREIVRSFDLTIELQRQRVTGKSVTWWSSLGPAFRTFGRIPKNDQDALILASLVAVKRNENVPGNSPIQWVVFSAAGGESEIVATAAVELKSSRREKDKTIHGMRFRMLHRAIQTLSNTMMKFKIAPLNQVEKNALELAVREVLSLSDLSTSPNFKTFVTALLKIEKFRRLHLAEQAHIILTWYNMLWLGTGEFGEPNDPPTGFCGRPIATITA